MVQTMSKKQRKFGPPQEAVIEKVEAPKPRVTSFVPRPCSFCTALREPNSNYSRVTSTQGNIRYCKCGFCNNTWKEQEHKSPQ